MVNTGGTYSDYIQILFQAEIHADCPARNNQKFRVCHSCIYCRNSDNICKNHQLGRLPGFIAFVICTFVLLLLAELIYNSLRAGEVRSINVFLRRKILQGMLGRPENENRESLGFLTNDFKLLETNRIDAEFDAILAVSTLTLALSYALYSNWILTVVFFAGSMIPVLASNLFQKPIQSASEKWTEANASYVGQVKNFIDASDCVRLYDRAEQVACKN